VNPSRQRPHHRRCWSVHCHNAITIFHPRTRADEREVLGIDGGAHDGARDVAELVDDGSAGVTSVDA
jgi:hypothetical protein